MQNMARKREKLNKQILMVLEERNKMRDSDVLKDMPIIDAHSQCCPENIGKVIQLMDRGGVACTILSSGRASPKGIVAPEELVSFASDYPDRIIPAIRTKIREYENYYEVLEKQMNMEQYGAMAEFLMYHVPKTKETRTPIRKRQGSRYEEFYPEDERVQVALNYALDREWPFVMHIEFAVAGSLRNVFMAKMEALLAQYPEHPFVLIHMGLLDHVDVRRLIEAYPNIHFITSHCNPIIIVITEMAKQIGDKWIPWTNMFDGDNLSADWKQLMIENPDRFILGFDMVLPWDWDLIYLPQIMVWRRAMVGLPLEVAHAFAHGNAERLWNLPPACMQ